MKDNRYLAKIKVLFNTGFFHIFSSSVLNKILVFFSNIIVVRIISKVDFGIYTYALNIVSFVLLVSGIGLVSGTFQLCSEKKEEEKESIYRYGCSVGIKVNIVLGLIIVLIAEFSHLSINGANEIMVLMLLNPFFLIVFEFQQIYLRSNFENKRYSYATTINTTLIMIASIIGSLALGVKGLIIFRYFAYIVTIFIIMYCYKVPVSIIRGAYISAEEKKVLFKISIVSMMNNGVSQLLYLLDIFILGVVISNEEIVASYKIATVIPTACIFIPTAIITYIYPYFASHKDDKRWCLNHYKMVIKYMSILNVLISAFMVIFAKWIIIIVYGAQYLDSLSCFRILVFSYFFSGTFRIISGNLLVTQRKLGVNFFISVISGVVNIFGNILLISKLGSEGAAITTLIVMIISSVLSTVYYVYILKKEN